MTQNCRPACLNRPSEIHRRLAQAPAQNFAFGVAARHNLNALVPDYVRPHTLTCLPILAGSTRSQLRSLDSASRKWWRYGDYLACRRALHSWLRPQSALSRRAVELKFSSPAHLITFRFAEFGGGMGILLLSLFRIQLRTLSVLAYVVVKNVRHDEKLI